jgi:TRAP-type C4-dicarboxylate transport system substrate-binding protein
MVRDKEDTMGRSMRMIAMSLTLVLVAAACSSGAESKAGGEQPPIVLTIGTNDFPGRPAADQIERFAARVADFSEGEITIEPVWRVGGLNAPNWDQAVARQVVNGELHMGNIPSRAFDLLGVKSLQALNAPFLITSDDLLNKVVASDLAGDLLSGLEEIGLVGLAVLPEGLRHPFGFEEGLVGPADYRGGVFRAPASATTAAVFEALGAEVVEGEIDPGSQTGMESAYIFDPLGTATANVVLFPKANVLVVNADVFGRLSETQKEVLEQAASDTLGWSIEFRTGDSVAAEEWCANGGTMVIADGDALAALQAAVEPVYRQLRSDQLTADLITRIEEIKTSVTTAEPAIPDGCTDQPVDRGATTAEDKNDPSVIDGSYRFQWDPDELTEAFIAVGAPRAEVEAMSSDNAGVVSLVFDDGRYEQIWETGFFAGDHCNGTYTISADRITMVASSDPAEYQCGNEDLGKTVADAVWELTDQGLVLSDFVLSDEPGLTWFTGVFFSKPLIRVD